MLVVVVVDPRVGSMSVQRNPLLWTQLLGKRGKETGRLVQSKMHNRKKDHDFLLNKLAKARKTRTSPGTLSLKKFGMGKKFFEKVEEKLRKLRKN